MSTPDDRRYTEQHEWAQVVDGGGPGAVVRVGLTDHAQEALGDVVFVQLPDVGTEVSAGTPLGEVESTKSVSEVYAPVSGVVTAVNDALPDAPETVNGDPYGAGWLVEIRVADGAADPVAGLLDAAAYRTLVGAS